MTASIDGKPRVLDVEENLAKQIRLKLGGNPSLLSYAHAYVRGGSKTVRRAREVVGQVTDAILNRDTEARLGSIYHSLSKRLRFFVRLVYDAEQNRNKQTDIYINQRPKTSLSDNGYTVAELIQNLGNLIGQVGHGFKLISILSDYLRAKELRGYDTFQGGHQEDRSYGMTF